MDATDRHPADEQLAVAAAAGDRDALEALVSRYGAVVLSTLENRCPDRHTAEDLSQEVWIKVARALPGWRPTGSFRSWLFAIALNQARDGARRHKRVPRTTFDGRLPGAEASHDPRGRIEERAALRAALARVGEPFRTAIELVDVHGLNYEEAARSADCRPGTMKSRVHRGRQAFRDEYLRLSGDAATTRPAPRALGATP